MCCDVMEIYTKKLPELTVSFCLYAQFWTVRIPLFALNFILKCVVTQWKTWLTITLTHTFILISLKTLSAYICEDTVIFIVLQQLTEADFQAEMSDYTSSKHSVVCVYMLQCMPLIIFRGE